MTTPAYHMVNGANVGAPSPNHGYTPRNFLALTVRPFVATR